MKFSGGKRGRTGMELSIVRPVERLSQSALTIVSASLYHAFEQVKDRRGKKGTRYPLAFVLTLIMLGKMAGEKEISGIIDWIKFREKELRRLLKWPKAFPSYDVYTRVLTHC